MHLGSDEFGYNQTSNTLMRPILVVPASATPGNISLGNVKAFLQDG